MKEEERDDLIPEYLDGKLTGNKLHDFEEKIREDESLSDEIADYEKIELNFRAIKADQFKNQVKEWESQYQSGTSASRYPFYYAIAASVSVLLVVSAILLLNTQPDLPSLYASNFQPYDDMIMTRGSDTEDENLVKGMNAYNNERYEEAIPFLTSYLQKNTEDDRICLYLGIAHMLAGNINEAEQNMKLALNIPEYQQQAEWYLAMLYLKNDRKTQAKNTLGRIANNPSHYKNKQANELLNEIE